MSSVTQHVLPKLHSLPTTTALLAYAAQVPEIAETKIDGLKKFYGVNDERGLAFFSVHHEAGKYHADTSRRILEQQVSADETDQITTACDQALTALWHMLDGVQERYC